MGDRIFASGGDSVHVGRREPPSGSSGQPSSWEDRWNRGPDTGPREIPADADATAGIVRRLQARVDRHRWLLDRMQSDPLQPEPAGLPELLDTVARMRRDTESLLMLHGQDPGVPPGGARRLSDVLAAAAAAAEEPRRVDVRSVPAAGVAPAAATELLHVLAEVVDHVTAVYPGARVDVSCAAEAPGGVVVEVRADGATHHDPEDVGGRRALGAARRLAQRSLSGIVLRSHDTGARASGPVASIHCPGSVVTLDAVPARGPERALTTWSAQRHRDPEPARPGSLRPNVVGPDSSADPNVFDPNGFDPNAFGTDARRSDTQRSDARRSDAQRSDAQRPPALPADPVRAMSDPLDADPLSGPLPLDRLLAESTRLEPPPPGSPRLDFTPTRPGSGPPSRANGNGRGRNGHGGAPHVAAPAYVPSAGSQVDELFGPMLDLAHDPADDDIATPIFEAVASAWFREDEPAADHRTGRHPGPVNGSGPGDSEPGGPRHDGGNPGAPRGGAAGKASGSGASTGAGAAFEGGPRNWETPSDVEWRAAAERAARPEPETQTSTGLPRRRPGNQLVPPLRAASGVPEPERPERVPDRVRDRLSTYQRGLRQGRHRAEPNVPDADPGDPAAW